MKYDKNIPMPLGLLKFRRLYELRKFMAFGEILYKFIFIIQFRKTFLQKERENQEKKNVPEEEVKKRTQKREIGRKERRK